MGDTLVGARFGAYELVREIGRGGMGVVYEARDCSLNRPAAIKLLPADAASDAEVRARFLREARAAATIVHPNVATIYAVDEANKQLYIAMELVPGTSLRTRLAAGGLPLAEALSMAEQIAKALEKAHAAGIVHRDLKPENIMISTDGIAKLLDFGIAKLLHPGNSGGAIDARTLPGQVLGTPGYAPPEQISGRPVDARADVFAFGVVVYEMISGSCPFRGAGVADLLAAVVRDDVPPLGAVIAGIPADVDAFLGRCLSKKPEQRHEHGASLVAAVARLRVADVATGVASTVPKHAATQAAVTALSMDEAAASTEPARAPRAGGHGATNIAEPRGEPGVLGGARERIQARRKARVDAAREDPFAEARVVAALARAVARVRGVVEAAIRSTVAEEGLPPFLLKTTEETARATLRVVFEPAAAHALHATLVVLYACSTPGGETGVVLVQCCAAVLGSVASFAAVEPPSGALETIFSDVADDARLADAVRATMVAAFDAAQHEFGSLAPATHLGWLRLIA